MRLWSQLWLFTIKKRKKKKSKIKIGSVLSPTEPQQPVRAVEQIASVLTVSPSKGDLTFCESENLLPM